MRHYTAISSPARTKSVARYRGRLSYLKEMVLHFQTDNRLQAMVKLSSPISSQYPYARGEINDATTGQVIYRCCQTAIC